MINIRKSLLQFIFAGSYMKRWNDKLRPMEFIEADKQAHKMIVAWLLCRLNGPLAGGDGPENAAAQIELEAQVIERGMFDYFFRLVITDIKPPVYYRIKENPSHYDKLARWVRDELEPMLGPLGEVFWKKFKGHIKSPDRHDLAASILDAAHNYASNWELGILKSMNDFDPEIPNIVEDFKRKLDAHSGLTGLDDMRNEKKSALGRFAKLCGQLRFQNRWSQTPRVPETSVMGHMLVVACYAYCFSLAVGACRARLVNNFWCALFHDLPELLTRDIISPVKKSSYSLGDLIRDYEDEELRRRVFAPLEKDGYADITRRMRYYLGQETGSEFFESVIIDGKVERVPGFDALHKAYNTDVYDPKDGELLKVCDNLAAFIEAYTAVRNGMSSDQLNQAIWRIRSENSRKSLGGLHIGGLLADFD